MFDVYSQCSTHVRNVAFSKPGTLPTWQEVFRLVRSDDVEGHLCKVFSETPLSLFAADLAEDFRRWQFNLLHQSARRVRVHRHYLPLKCHSPVHR